MIFYLATVDDAMEGEVACETLREARAVRDKGTKVRKIETPPITRALLCAVYNRAAFAVKQEEIE